MRRRLRVQGRGDRRRWPLSSLGHMASEQRGRGGVGVGGWGGCRVESLCSLAG